MGEGRREGRSDRAGRICQPRQHSRSDGLDQPAHTRRLHRAGLPGRRGRRRGRGGSDRRWFGGGGCPDGRGFGGDGSNGRGADRRGFGGDTDRGRPGRDGPDRGGADGGRGRGGLVVAAVFLGRAREVGRHHVVIVLEKAHLCSEGGGGFFAAGGGGAPQSPLTSLATDTPRPAGRGRTGRGERPSDQQRAAEVAHRARYVRE